RPAGEGRAWPSSCGVLPRLTPMPGRDIRVKPVTDRFEVGLCQVTLEQAPHARLEAPITRLAIPFPKAREDPEDARVPLRGERPISRLECLPVAGSLGVAVDHRSLHLG